MPNLVINGRTMSVDAANDTPLLWVSGWAWWHPSFRQRHRNAIGRTGAAHRQAGARYAVAGARNVLLGARVRSLPITAKR